MSLYEEHRFGLPCAASLDNLHPIRKTFLTDLIGSLRLPRQEICQTFAAMADC
jgi:hypothetical protein